MNEFLKYLENSNEEIFIDTVGANHDVSVKYLYECWTKKGNAYYWFNQNYINNASVVSYFIVNSKQPRPYIGSVVGSGKIVTSYQGKQIKTNVVEPNCQPFNWQVEKIDLIQSPWRNPRGFLCIKTFLTDTKCVILCSRGEENAN